MKRIYLSIFTFLVVTAGCGDNALDNAQPDVQCTDSSGPCAVVVAPGQGGPAGILSTLDVDAMTMQTNVAAGVVKSDPILRRIDDTLYVINRDINSVTMLDARTFMLLGEVAIGDNSNPQDVAVVGNKLFVPALSTSGVVVVTPGSETRTLIDLQKDLDCEGDCLPSCASAYAIDNDVYVACGLLKGFEPTGNGKVVVIDGTTNAVRHVIELPVKNPFGLMVRTPVASALSGDLLIPTYNNDDKLDTCIARLTPGATPSTACAIPYTELKGMAGPMDVLEDPSPLLLIAVASTDFTGGQLRVFDLQSEQLWSGSVSPPTQVVKDVAACPNGKIVVADTATNGGLRIYGTSGLELTTTALSIGVPPGYGNNLVCYTPD